jgi:hypothetical protein
VSATQPETAVFDIPPNTLTNIQHVRLTASFSVNELDVNKPRIPSRKEYKSLRPKTDIHGSETPAEESAKGKGASKRCFADALRSKASTASRKRRLRGSSETVLKKTF